MESDLATVVRNRGTIDCSFAHVRGYLEIVERGYLETVKYCYFLGYDPSSMLTWACMHEHCDIVDFFLSIDLPNVKGKDLLVISCQNGNFHIFNSLLRAGINDSSSGWCDPVCTSVKNRRKDFILQLCIHGFAMNAIDMNGYNGLHHACVNRDLEMVKLLLSLGVCPNTQCLMGKLPIELACQDKYAPPTVWAVRTIIAESLQTMNDRIEIIKLLLPSYERPVSKLIDMSQNEQIRQAILSQ